MRLRFTSTIIVMLCIATIMSACSKNETHEITTPDVVDGILLTTDEQNISPSGLTLCIQNTGTDTVYLGPWYCLEKRTEENWVSVNPLPGALWSENDWLMSIYPNTQEEITYTWDWYYGELLPGEFRIIVSITKKDDNDTSASYKLASTFLIS